MTQSIERLLVQIDATTESLRREMKRAEDATGQFQRQTDQKLGQFDRKFGQVMQRAGREASQLSPQLAGISRSLAMLASPAGAAAAGVAGLTAAMTAGTRVAGRFEQLGLRTEAIIRATGASAGLTAKQIDAFAQSLALGTLASAEGVERAAQKLLTFRSVAGETFTRTLELSQDLAAIGFGTIESAATQLGKALEDPASGLSALTRVGVSFSEQQKRLIRDLTEGGRVAEAQGVILDTLAGQVGGAGRAEAGGLSGAYDTLAQSVETFLRNVGDSGPLDAATEGVNRLARALNGLNDVFFQSEIDEAMAAIPRLIENINRREALGDTGARLDQLREQLRAYEAIVAVERQAEREAEAASAAYQANMEAEAEAAKEAASAAEKAEQARKSAEAAARRAAEADEAARRKRLEGLTAIRDEITALERLDLAHREGAAAVEAVKTALELETEARRLGIEEGSREMDVLERLIGLRSTLTDRIESHEQALLDEQRAADTALRAQQRAADDAIRQVERRIDSVVDFGAEQFALLFDETSRGWQGLLDSMLDALRRTFARMAAEAVLRPIVAPIIGGLVGGGMMAGSASAAGLGGSLGGSAGGFSVSGLSALGNLGGLGGGLVNAALTSSVGQALGLSAALPSASTALAGGGALTLGGGVALTNAGSALASGLGAAPWGIIGGLGANLLGLGGGVGGMLGGAAGAIGGGMAGASLAALGAVGGPIGAILGAFAGTALGGLFGSKPSDMTQGASITADRITADGFTGKKFSQEIRDAADAVAANTQTLLGVIRETTGATLPGAIGIKIGARDRSEVYYGGRTMASAAAGDPQELMQATASTIARLFADRVPAEVATALRRIDTSDMQRAVEDVAFAAMLAGGKLFPEPEEISQIEVALKAVDEQAAAMLDRAKRLGLDAVAVERLAEAERNRIVAGFDDDVRRQLLGITEPVRLAIEMFREEAAERLRIAEAIGADVTAVERLIAEERLRLQEGVYADARAAADALAGGATAANRDNARADLAAMLRAAEGGTLADPAALAATIRGLAGSSADFGSALDFRREVAAVRAAVARIEATAFDVPGFATGGSFTVGGAPGSDRVFAPLRLTRGEHVNVSREDSVAKLAREVAGLRATVEAGQRAIAKHTSDTAARLKRWDYAGMPAARET